jgi:glucarate dehydratase
MRLYFTRILVLLTDSAGNTGMGEVPGSDGILQALRKLAPLVVGTETGRHRRTLNTLRAAVSGASHQVTSSAEAAVMKQPHEINLRHRERGHGGGGRPARPARPAPRRAAVRTARRGPAAHATCTMLAYLFYVGDRKRTDLAYDGGAKATLTGTGLRDREALSPEADRRPGREPPSTSTASATSS